MQNEIVYQKEVIYETHTPSVVNISQIFHKDSMNYKWNSLECYSNMMYKTTRTESQNLCSLKKSAFPIDALLCATLYKSVLQL